MNTLLKFAALVLGFSLWAALGYVGKVPLDPLIALLQMGLGGLITHMLQAGGDSAPASAPAASAPPAVAPGQGGFHTLRFVMLLAFFAMLAAALSACTTAMRAYESAAAVQIKEANDNALAIWKSAACIQPVGAVLRDPDVIDSVNRFCGGAKAQLGANQPITVNVTIPAPAAAASSAK